MKWEKTVIDLGNITTEKKQIITFQALEDIDVKEMISSCGCSKPVFIKSKNQIIVTYTPGKIPMHLRHVGFYISIKSVIVRYQDGTQDILKFKATINE